MCSEKSTIRTASLDLPANTVQTGVPLSVPIKLPKDMDVFRLQIQLCPLEVNQSVGIGIPFLLLSGQSFGNGFYGYRLYINVVNGLISPSDSLIMDRRGTGSKMADDIHVAYFSQEEVEPIKCVCNIIYEGYIQ